MKVSIDQIKVGYTEEKRRWEFCYPWLYFFSRPVSFWITCWLIPLGISANQANFISLIIGLASFTFFTFGYGFGFYMGSILLILFKIMDCVDGNIARFKKTDGPVGIYFDGLIGNVHTLVYIFIGLGLYISPDRSLMFIWPEFDYTKAAGITLFCAGVITTVMKMLSMQVRSNFFSILGQQWKEYKDKQGYKDFSHVGKWYYYVYNNVTDLQAHEFILFLAVVMHLVGLFVILSALISLLNLVFLVFFYTRRIRKLRKVLGE